MRLVGRPTLGNSFSLEIHTHGRARAVRALRAHGACSGPGLVIALALDIRKDVVGLEWKLNGGTGMGVSRKASGSRLFGGVLFVRARHADRSLRAQ